MASPNGSRKKPVANKVSIKNTKNKISKRGKPAPPVQQKTKSKTGSVKKKRKVYTAEELGIPKLNTIVAVGVDQPNGKKKGKVFVDDQESMMAILAVVNAGKEGQIESKMMKSRHMEEIREARQKEAEAKQAQKKLKLDETKDSLRRKRKRRPEVDLNGANVKNQETQQASKANRKRVSFA